VPAKSFSLSMISPEKSSTHGTKKNTSISAEDPTIDPNLDLILKSKKIIKLIPGFPVFRETVPAIDRPALSWLEGDFAFFSTV
jgi:hypothetical protein